MKNIIVIGGGPAGMMAAISAATAGAKVSLWERNQVLGKKLAITGKGRCNITNQCSIEELIANLPGNGQFLYGAFNRFNSDDICNFFSDYGLNLKTERGRRVFPASDKAQDVVALLAKVLAEQKVDIHYQRRAQKLLWQEGKICGAVDDKGQQQLADAIILATGGKSYPLTGSDGDGYRLAQAVGHHITDLRAALAPLNTRESWPAEISGLSLKNVNLKAVWQDKIIGEEFGEMLFTHFGVSGPIVLSLSRAISALPEQGQGCQLLINLKPALSEEQLDLRLQRDLNKEIRKQVGNALADLLPQALWPICWQQAQVNPQKKANQISRNERKQIIHTLQNLKLTVAGPRPLKEAIVTAGGVDVKEIIPKTMASKKISGLYICGELLDIDGFTGGYNLQAAWSSGYIAGQSAADI